MCEREQSSVPPTISSRGDAEHSAAGLRYLWRINPFLVNTTIFKRDIPVFYRFLKHINLPLYVVCQKIAAILPLLRVTSRRITTLAIQSELRAEQSAEILRMKYLTVELPLCSGAPKTSLKGQFVNALSFLGSRHITEMPKAYKVATACWLDMKELEQFYAGSTMWEAVAVKGV